MSGIDGKVINLPVFSANQSAVLAVTPTTGSEIIQKLEISPSGRFDKLLVCRLCHFELFAAPANAMLGMRQTIAAKMQLNRSGCQ